MICYNFGTYGYGVSLVCRTQLHGEELVLVTHAAARDGRKILRLATYYVCMNL